MKKLCLLLALLTLIFLCFADIDEHYSFNATAGTYTQTIAGVSAINALSQDNDLAATSINGNTTPSVNAATPYTVRIRNCGLMSQSTYSVQLIDATNTVLASVNGVPLAAGESHNFELIWTPTILGPVQLHGKVLLLGDENVLNDQTPDLPIMVFPAGILAINIGSGTNVGRIPMDFYYKNSLYETLYYTDEMCVFGSINHVTFYFEGDANPQLKPLKIWLGTTTQNDLSMGWIPATELTLVFDGNVNFPSGPNEIIIPLQTPFTYASGNLVMMVERPMDTSDLANTDRFRIQQSYQLRALNIYSDAIDFDPYNPPAGTFPQRFFPQTSFHMIPLSEDPVIFISPLEWDFDTVLLNSTHNKQIRIMNRGGGSLGINNITINGSPFFTLQDMPALPALLNTGQEAFLTVRYQPTAVGEHTATITITDDQSGTLRGTKDKRSREMHTLNVAGNCIDPTIFSLPYLQNFDAVTAPALPLQWSSIVQSNDEDSGVVTVSEESYSAPNHVILYVGGDPLGQVILVAPPYAADIATNTTRTKFRARYVCDVATLDVGVLSDAQDPSTFVLLHSVTLSYLWEEYVLSFEDYAGAGKWIAFRYSNNIGYSIIGLDDILLEVDPENDLAALSIEGNIAPPFGMSASYTVNVFNWGSNAQTNYQIKLYKQGDLEIGSINGAAINPGQLLPQTINWIPDAEGPTFIYAKIVMTTDQNPLNDQSPNLNLNVQPYGIVALTVGTALGTARMPMDMSHRNSLYECMFYPIELQNTIGIIHGIAFYNDFSSNLSNKPVKIWLGTTNLADLSGGYIPSTELTQVFEGSVDFPSGQNLIFIAFTQPYQYLEGGNLVMMVERPMDNNSYYDDDLFQGQNDNSFRAINAYSNDIDFDPTAPHAGIATSFFPKTSFYIVPNGAGHLQGTITDPDSQPIAGVSVTFNLGGYNVVSSPIGVYDIYNIIEGDYTVCFSRQGYISQSHNVSIPEDELLILNVVLQPMPTVNVTGSVRASDTGAALAEALIHLSGYQNYYTNTSATGGFNIPTVYPNQSYDYTIMCPGYTKLCGTIAIGGTDYDMGTLTINEMAYAPHNVQAELNATYDAINLNWEAPEPTAILTTKSFEAELYPSCNITNGIARIEASLPHRRVGRSPRDSQRVLNGYRVYRLLTGQESNEASWIELSSQIITGLNLEDESWTSLPDGSYRWAIRAIYSAGVVSSASFSNPVVHEQLLGTIVGFVQRSNGQGIPGATVNSGENTASTDNAGAYSLYLPVGLHDVTAAAPSFHSQTIEAINVIPNQNITINFVMVPVSTEDELNPVVATALKGNIPNPFNPSTTILYSILEPCEVRLDIYNTRGQKVRSLMHEWQPKGHHSVVFSGKDDRGQGLASGIYFYRFSAGKYTATRKMLLME